MATLVDLGGPQLAASISLGLFGVKHKMCARKPASDRVLVLPHLSSGLEFTACAQNRCNAVCAVLERVVYQRVAGSYCPAAPPVPGALRLLEPFLRRWRAIVPKVTPVPLGEYAALSYRGRRLQLYAAAEQRLIREGLSKHSARVRAFIKHEKLPFGLKRVVPRIIQPRSPEFNVAIGRYMRHLEHDVYRAITRVFGGDPGEVADVVVTKGLNATEVAATLRGKWEKFADPICVALDASRFDQHIGPQLLDFEHRMWKCFYPKDREFAKLCRMQLRQPGSLWVDDTLISFVSSTRCSGDMNTASGNCMLMCAMAHSFLDKHRLVRHVEFYDNGDDCGFIGERGDLEPVIGDIVPHFDLLGIVMKVEPPVDVFERVSFCQTQPVYDGSEWVMVREPFAALSKDASCLTPSLILNPNDSSQDYILALGLCGLALTGGIPVMQEYYRAYVRGRGRNRAYRGSRLIETGMWQLAQGMSRPVAPVSVQARVSFERAFGITPDAQIHLERHFASLSGVGHHLVTPFSVAKATVFSAAT